MAAAEARRARHQLQRLRRHRARREPGAQGRRKPLVPVPAAVDGDVLHRQRAGAAVLHRAVLAAGLRATTRSAMPRRRACGRSGTARRIREFRAALQSEAPPSAAPAAGCAGASECASDSAARRRSVSAIIPCLDEEDAIGACVAAVLARGVGEVIVVDGGSRDRTVERASAAGARVIVERRRGYGRAMLAGIAAMCSVGLRSCCSSTATAATGRR